MEYQGSKANTQPMELLLHFQTLFKEGNLGGIVVGASPYASKAEVPKVYCTGGNWFGSDL